jgi:hypothetical protein
VFFAVALQSIEINGVPIRFEIDAADSAICRMTVGEHVATFQRNGPLISVEGPDTSAVTDADPAPAEPAPPPESPDGTVEEPPEPPPRRHGRARTGG